MKQINLYAKYAQKDIIVMKWIWQVLKIAHKEINVKRKALLAQIHVRRENI